jgi:hypothetical protein
MCWRCSPGTGGRVGGVPIRGGLPGPRPQAPGSVQLVAKVGPHRLVFYCPSISYTALVCDLWRYRVGDVLDVQMRQQPALRPLRHG